MTFPTLAHMCGASPIPQVLVTTPMRRNSRLTVPEVGRIAERIAKGLPIRHACALETPRVDPAAYLRALSKNPRFKTIHEVALARFMEKIIDTLLSEDRSIDKAGLQFLLRCRFKDMFTVNESQVTQTNTVNNFSLPKDVLERAKEFVKLANRGSALVSKVPNPKR